MSIIIFLGVTVMFWKFRAPLTALLTQWQRQRAESETAYFQRVASACRSNDPVASLNAVLAWLDRLSANTQPATITGFLDMHRDAELTHELDGLQRAALQHTGGWSGQTLLVVLTRLHKSRRHAKPGLTPERLPALNP